MWIKIWMLPQQINKSRLTVHVTDTRNRKFSFSIAFCLQHSRIFHLMGDYTRGRNNYVQETILRLHHEQYPYNGSHLPYFWIENWSCFCAMGKSCISFWSMRQNRKMLISLLKWYSSDKENVHYGWFFILLTYYL